MEKVRLENGSGRGKSVLQWFGSVAASALVLCVLFLYFTTASFGVSSCLSEIIAQQKADSAG